MIVFPPRFGTRPATAFLLALGLTLTASRPAIGQSSPPALTWAPAGGSGGSGTWDETTANWSNGTGNVPWTDGDTALFGGTAGTVSINGSVAASQVTFSTPGYVVQNFFLDGAGSGLTVQADADATISSSVFGPGGSSNAPFTKTGAGVLTFTGQGPVFFGSANVNAGEVRFTGTGAPNFTTSYVLADAPGVALTFASTFNQIASLGGGGSGSSGTSGAVVRPNVNFSSSLTLSIYGSSSASFGGMIQDNGGATLAFQKTGSSTQTLTGANTYSGATTVSGGTLSFAGANGAASNTSSVVVNTGGTLLLDNSLAASTARLPSQTSVTLNGGTLSIAGNATAGSKQQFLNPLTFSRASTITAVTAGTAEAKWEFSGLTRQNNGTIAFAGNGTILGTGLTIQNGIAAPYATFNGTDWVTLDASGNAVAYTGYTSNLSSAASTDNLRLDFSGGSSYNLGKTQSRNSLDLVNNGSATGVLQIGVGQTLTLTSGGVLTSGSAGHLIQNGTLTTSGNELIVTNQAALTMAATLTNGSAGAVTLTKSGVGTLALLGNNTYTGSTVINQGMVQAGTDANLGAGSVVTLNGGTLQASGSFTSTKSLQGNGGAVDTNGYNVAFSGGVNTGPIIKNGAGMLALTGTVSSASVNAGTLRLTNLATGNAASINLFGGRVEASGSGVQRIESFGTVTPPEISPGAIGQAAALTLGSLAVTGATIIDFDLGSAATDSLTLSSGLFLNGGSGNPQLLFRFGNLGGTRIGTAYTLLNLPASNPTLSVSEFGIDSVSAAAGYQGTFTLANNTLSVTFTSVPEPGVCLWLCGALSIWTIGARFGRKPRADERLR